MTHSCLYLVPTGSLCHSLMLFSWLATKWVSMHWCTIVWTCLTRNTFLYVQYSQMETGKFRVKQRAYFRFHMHCSSHFVLISTRTHRSEPVTSLESRFVVTWHEYLEQSCLPVVNVLKNLMWHSNPWVLYMLAHRSHASWQVLIGVVHLCTYLALFWYNLIFHILGTLDWAWIKCDYFD